MRVADIYLRRDDKLTENRVFIDLLDWMHQQGPDVLGRLANQPRGSPFWPRVSLDRQ